MLTALSLLCVTVSAKADNTKVDTLTLFNEATFYDGYLFDKNPDSLVSDGILRHSTSLYAVKLKPEQLALIGDSLRMDVFVKACCDNYDRIGNINLAFVPKGDTTYIPDSTTRIEIGRFITPFMNKNKQPDVVLNACYFQSMVLLTQTFVGMGFEPKAMLCSSSARRRTTAAPWI